MLPVRKSSPRTASGFELLHSNIPKFVFIIREPTWKLILIWTKTHHKYFNKR